MNVLKKKQILKILPIIKRLTLKLKFIVTRRIVMKPLREMNVIHGKNIAKFVLKKLKRKKLNVLLVLIRLREMIVIHGKKNVRLVIISNLILNTLFMNKIIYFKII
jgi:hypothetical protein